MKKTPPAFFVTGMPRSRSAWLSQWLTAPGQACLHEPLRHMDALDPKRLADLLEAEAVLRGVSRIGVADQGLVVVPELLRDLQESPVLVVRRNSAAVAASLGRHANQPPSQFLELAERWAVLTEDLILALEDRCLVVEFEALVDESVAEKVWRHLCPDTPFDAGRWREVSRLRIDTVPSRTYDNRDQIRRALELQRLAFERSTVILDDIYGGNSEPSSVAV